MSRLIDADAFSIEMKKRQDECSEWVKEAKGNYRYRALGAWSMLSEVKLTLDKMPTIDAVEVVRCGECIHHEEPRDTFLKAFVWCNFCNTHKLKNGYCNCGERKDEEEQNDE